MGNESNWGDLEPHQVESIKHHISQAVSEGIVTGLLGGDIQAAIADGVTHGLHRAASDELLFDQLTASTAAAFRRGATKASGEFVLGGLWGLARRAAWFVLLGIVVYSLGGWSALAALWKSLITSPA